MRVRKFCVLLLALAVCMNSLSMTAMAATGTEPQTKTIVARATGRFNMNVPGGKIVKANSSLPLEAGETVTIKASYTPFSASVDFGLIAPDGYFYYINTNDGSFDETIKVDQRGNYTFAVMNNSSEAISVSGYINY